MGHCTCKKTPYQKGYAVGKNWMIGQIIPSPDAAEIYDPSFADNEQIALWFQGLNDAIQQQLITDPQLQQVNDKLNITLLAPNPDQCHDCVQLNRLKDIVYPMARLVRGTDSVHPSSRGPELGKLLLKLRMLNGANYDELVISHG